MKKDKKVKYKIRCNAQDPHGHRCKNDAIIETDYHGDGEIYSYGGPEPIWVRIFFCKKHSK